MRGDGVHGMGCGGDAAERPAYRRGALLHDGIMIYQLSVRWRHSSS